MAGLGLLRRLRLRHVLLGVFVCFWLAVGYIMLLHGHNAQQAAVDAEFDAMDVSPVRERTE